VGDRLDDGILGFRNHGGNQFAVRWLVGVQDETRVNCGGVEQDAERFGGACARRMPRKSYPG
jgi:hypothetical protein